MEFGVGWVEFKDVCGLGRGSRGGLCGFKVGVRSPLSRIAGEGQGEGGESSNLIGFLVLTY